MVVYLYVALAPFYHLIQVLTFLLSVLCFQNVENSSRYPGVTFDFSNESRVRLEARLFYGPNLIRV